MPGKPAAHGNGSVSKVRLRLQGCISCISRNWITLAPPNASQASIASGLEARFDALRLSPEQVRNETHHGGAKVAIGPPKSSKRGRTRVRAPVIPSAKVRADQKSIPPAGMAGAASFFGFSATMASVVTSRPATEPAPSSALRTTLTGSMTPCLNRSPYLPVCAFQP